MSEPSTFKFLSREMLAQGNWTIGTGGTTTIAGDLIVTGASSFEGNIGMFGVFTFQNTTYRDAAAASLNVARLGTDNVFSPLRTNSFGTVNTVNLGADTTELGTDGGTTRVYGYLMCSLGITVGSTGTFSADVSIGGAFTHLGGAVSITNAQVWRTALGVPGLTGDNTLGGNLSVVGNLTVGGIFSHTATAANVVSLANPQAWRLAMSVPGLATDNIFTALTNTFQGQVSVLGSTNLGDSAADQLSLKGVLAHTLGTLSLDATTLTSWKTTLGITGAGGIDEALAGKANLAGGNSFTGNQAIAGTLTVNATYLTTLSGGLLVGTSFRSSGTVTLDNASAWKTALSLPANTTTSLAGKANLAGGNTFTGNQNFNDSVSTMTVYHLSVAEVSASNIIYSMGFTLGADGAFNLGDYSTLNFGEAMYFNYGAGSAEAHVAALGLSNVQADLSGKANLTGGNTWTGDQFFNDGVSTIWASFLDSPTIYSNSISTTDLEVRALTLVYGGTFIVGDDVAFSYGLGSAEAHVAALGLSNVQTDLSGKANLDGGNSFTGTQNFGDPVFFFHETTIRNILRIEGFGGTAEIIFGDFMLFTYTAGALVSHQDILGITTINTSLAGKADRAGDTFTGAVTFSAGLTSSTTFTHNALTTSSVTLNANATTSWKTALSLPTNTLTSLTGKANVAGGNAFTGAQTFAGLSTFNAGAVVAANQTLAFGTAGGTISTPAGNDRLELKGTNYVNFYVGGVKIGGFNYNSLVLDKPLIFGADGASDIGMNGTGRPNNIWAVGNITTAGNVSAVGGSFTGIVTLGAGATVAANQALTFGAGGSISSAPSNDRVLITGTTYIEFKIGAAQIGYFHATGLALNSGLAVGGNLSVVGGLTVNSGGGALSFYSEVERLSWAKKIDVGLAPNPAIDPAASGFASLNASNTMSSGVVEFAPSGPVGIRIDDITQVKKGDVWEICQAGPGVGTMLTSSAVGGQVVNLQFPPGGGPKTAGQWSTIFARVRAVGSGNITVLVTGGVA